MSRRFNSNKGSEQIDTYSKEVVDDTLNMLARTISYDDSPTQQRPKMAAHCDCFEANAAYLGRNFRPGFKKDSLGENFEMVPTTLRAGTHDTCAHCGYTTMQKVTVDLSKRHAGYQAAAEKMRAKRSKAVVGTCLTTGTVLNFPSAQDAYENGYGSVAYAIKRTKGVLKGYQWRLA